MLMTTIKANTQLKVFCTILKLNFNPVFHGFCGVVVITSA